MLVQYDHSKLVASLLGERQFAALPYKTLGTSLTAISQSHFLIPIPFFWSRLLVSCQTGVEQAPTSFQFYTSHTLMVNRKHFTDYYNFHYTTVPGHHSHHTICCRHINHTPSTPSPPLSQLQPLPLTPFLGILPHHNATLQRFYPTKIVRASIPLTDTIQP